MTSNDHGAGGSRYEFRVWGARGRTRERLAGLADVERTERIEDCYLLVPDPACNAKIRRRRLKIKHLVEEQCGFQRWSARWHDTGVLVPEPFDELALELCRHVDDVGNGSELADLIDELERPHRFRAVYVTKWRRRFRFGSIRAEISDISIDGQARRLSTTAIEGPDLGDLVRLRSSLGLTRRPNVALHLALATAEAISPPAEGPG